MSGRITLAPRETGAVQQDRADLVRRCHGFWADRDLPSLLEVVAEDAVLDLTRNVFNAAVYRGHDGVRCWVETVDEMWQGFEIGSPEIRGQTDDQVVTAVRMAGGGSGSGEMEVFQVWTVGEGKIVRIVGGYRSRDAALAELE